MSASNSVIELSDHEPAERVGPVIELSDDEPEERVDPVVATTTSRHNIGEAPLIPSDCGSALEGTQSFQSVFEARWRGNGDDGRLMPPFFIGTLKAAISEYVDCPNEHRSLALYIHHDGSVCRNIFPQSVLCNDAVLSLLHSSFILWPWDVTAKKNADKLIGWLAEVNLDDVRAHIDSSIEKVDEFPQLILLSNEDSELRMVAHVIGSEDPNQAMEKLIFYAEAYATVAATTNDVIPLIPAGCTSALEGTLSFSTVFEQRYCANEGLLLPPFFIGSLPEAMMEAFGKPTIADRRPLALYVHQDGMASKGVFPKKLCAGDTVALLRSNFVLWPWDVTEKENRENLIAWLELTLDDVSTGVMDAIARSNNNGLTMMLVLTKDEDEVKVEEMIEEDDADKIFDTLTKVVKQYEDVKPPVASRKRSHPADE